MNGVITTEDLSKLRFLAADYSETGEGRTISLLVTVLQPSVEEWKSSPEWVPGEGYRFGTLRVSQDEVLRRQFADRFDGWLAQGMEILDEESFVARFGKYVPDLVTRILKSRDFGAFGFMTQVYVNFS